MSPLAGCRSDAVGSSRGPCPVRMAETSGATSRRGRDVGPGVPDVVGVPLGEPGGRAPRHGGPHRDVGQLVREHDLAPAGGEPAERGGVEHDAVAGRGAGGPESGPRSSPPPVRRPTPPGARGARRPRAWSTAPAPGPAPGCPSTARAAGARRGRPRPRARRAVRSARCRPRPRARRGAPAASASPPTGRSLRPHGSLRLDLPAGRRNAPGRTPAGRPGRRGRGRRPGSARRPAPSPAAGSSGSRSAPRWSPRCAAAWAPRACPARSRRRRRPAHRPRAGRPAGPGPRRTSRAGGAPRRSSGRRPWRHTPTRRLRRPRRHDGAARRRSQR